MIIDEDFAIIELTDPEADEYLACIGCHDRVLKAARDLANETDRTVEIRRASSGILIGVVKG